MVDSTRIRAADAAFVSACAGARQVGVGVVTGLVHDDVGYMEIQVSV